jgi:hypothetical protein
LEKDKGKEPQNPPRWHRNNLRDEYPPHNMMSPPRYKALNGHPGGINIRDNEGPHRDRSEDQNNQGGSP